MPLGIEKVLDHYETNDFLIFFSPDFFNVKENFRIFGVFMDFFGLLLICDFFWIIWDFLGYLVFLGLFGIFFGIFLGIFWMFKIFLNF